MILSTQSIRMLCSAVPKESNQPPMLMPFCERARSHGLTYGLGPCSYDVRIREPLIMSRGGFAKASTIEHVCMPVNVAAKVADKSTWARRGLSVFNTLIDPGFHGFVTIEMVYHGTEPLTIEPGTPIAQIMFFWLDQPTERPYAGKYSGQPAKPVDAILEAGE
jgi:dCTP deaminase